MPLQLYLNLWQDSPPLVRLLPVTAFVPTQVFCSTFATPLRISFLQFLISKIGIEEIAIPLKTKQPYGIVYATECAVIRKPCLEKHPQIVRKRTFQLRRVNRPQTERKAVRASEDLQQQPQLVKVVTNTAIFQHVGKHIEVRTSLRFGYQIYLHT